MIEEAYQQDIKKGKDLKLELPFVEYIAYRELRLSGFVLKKKEEKGTLEEKVLECGKKPLIRGKLQGIWKRPFFYSWDKKAPKWYEKYWLGQHLSYKRKQGQGTFYDEYESYYLYEKNVIEKVPRPPFYQYYKEWRECGYVVKGAFKFGALFRIYERGTRPTNAQHSLYLLRVLEKKRYKGLEFFSVLRIAESVRKKLILPWERPSPRKPHYALYKGSFLGYLVILYEGENIWLPKLWGYAQYAFERKSPLFLGVVDRDTSLTLFRVSPLKLKQPYLLIERVKY
ncbi:MAG: hypothetical protein GXN92_00620 [Candidatus Micrarchaeota archaeon]|nr:hypothetical protein [Candidatus Micrarchaeota archaeon]